MDTDPAMLSVRYRPPESRLRNGGVTRYVIRYTRVDSGVSQMITFQSDYNGLRISVIPGLVAFTNYSVEVAAVNDNGTGPFSDVVLSAERPVLKALSFCSNVLYSACIEIMLMLDINE